jgi:hypothetical protein
MERATTGPTRFALRRDYLACALQRPFRSGNAALCLPESPPRDAIIRDTVASASQMPAAQAIPALRGTLPKIETP